MDTVIYITSLLFDVSMLLIYFRTMLFNRKKKTNIFVIILGILLADVLLAFVFFYFEDIHTLLRLAITIFVSLTTTFALTFFYDVPLRHRIFVAITFQLYCNISEYIVYFSYLFYLNLSGNDYTASDYIMNMISKVVAFILIIITFLIRNRKKMRYGIQYSLLILFTPIISIIALLAVSYTAADNTSALSLQAAAVIGLLFLNIANYTLLDSLIISKELKEKEQNLLKQIKYQSEKYDMISIAYRDTRRLIHDTKKHLHYIKSLITRQETDNACDYIDTELSALDQEHSSINCGNLVIDSFVGYYMQLARNEDILFETRIRIINDQISVSDYDLCVIIGNLLDNAIEENRINKDIPGKKIVFEAYTSDNNFVIHVKNTLSSPDRSDSDLKNGNLYHGFGIENIEITVKKYNGVYTREIKDGQFCSIIVIPVL